MNKYEEIYFVAGLIAKADANNSVELNNTADWENLLLVDKIPVREDYLLELNDRGVLNYEEIGEDGFKPIIVCSVTPQTREYLKRLIVDIENEFQKKENEIKRLENRINEILTFTPKKLSQGR